MGRAVEQPCLDLLRQREDSKAMDKRSSASFGIGKAMVGMQRKSLVLLALIGNGMARPGEDRRSNGTEQHSEGVVEHRIAKALHRSA